MNAMARLKRLEGMFKQAPYRGAIFASGEDGLNSVLSFIETSAGEYTDENHPSLESAEAKYPGVNVYIANNAETIAVVKDLIQSADEI